MGGDVAADEREEGAPLKRIRRTPRMSDPPCSKRAPLFALEFEEGLVVFYAEEAPGAKMLDAAASALESDRARLPRSPQCPRADSSVAQPVVPGRVG
jgi:hypothetical protein